MALTSLYDTKMTAHKPTSIVIKTVCVKHIYDPFVSLWYSHMYTRMCYKLILIYRALSCNELKWFSRYRYQKCLYWHVVYVDVVFVMISYSVSLVNKWTTGWFFNIQVKLTPKTCFVDINPIRVLKCLIC